MCENDILINTMLENYYFSNFRNKNSNKHFNLFLLSSCNNNCSYCYLKKHQKELYPKELECYDTIFNNLQLFLNWYIQNEFKTEIDLFSGEWLTIKEFYLPVFNIFINTFSNVPPSKRPVLIGIPDNMQFILSEEHTNNIQNFINSMKLLGIKVLISASIDGKIVETYRKDFPADEYYNKIFDFLTKNNFLCHPMIGAINIDKQIENYKWWKANAPKHVWEHFGGLEIRDNNWTPSAINKYLQYLSFVIDDTFNDRFKKNKIKMLKYILKRDEKNASGQSPIALSLQNYYTTPTICSFFHSLTIRMADLAIAPCHRLCYPELIIGKFNVENNKITDVTAHCAEMLIMKEYAHKSSLPHCENCQFVYMCPGHCLGAAYETYDNPLVPLRTVCDLFIAKYSFLILKYYEMGLWKYLDSVLDPQSFESIYLKKVIDNVVEGAINKGIYVPKEEA